MKKILSLFIISVFALLAFLGGKVNAESNFSPADELNIWNIETEGGSSYVNARLSSEHGSDEKSLYVTITKNGTAFGGVKRSLESEINNIITDGKNPYSLNFKFYNENELEYDEKLYVIIGVKNFGDWVVADSQTIGENNLPSFMESGESLVSINLNAIPNGYQLSDIECIKIGANKDNDVNFYLYDFSFGVMESAQDATKISEIKCPIDGFDTTLARAMDWSSDFDASSEVITNESFSKSADHMAIKVTNNSTSDGVLYAYIFPLNSEINKVHPRDVQGVSFYLYNTSACANGGVYFKLNDGDETLNVKVYGEDGNEITVNKFSMNFTGFRKYVVNADHFRLAKKSLELGVYGMPAQHVHYLSDFSILNVDNSIGDIKMSLTTQELTYYSWPENNFETTKTIVSDRTVSHSEDGYAIQIERASTDSWAVAQLYIKDFKNKFLAGSGATKPVEISFWVYNEISVPLGVNGLVFKYGNEKETYNYFWTDENGNVGTGGSIDFVGFRKFTVIGTFEMLNIDQWYFGIWGTAHSNTYFSDFSIFDSYVVPSVDDVTNVNMQPIDENTFEKVEYKYENEIVEGENALVLSVNSNNTNGKTTFTRNISNREASSSIIRVELSGKGNVMLGLNYDDGSGVCAPYFFNRSITLTDTKKTYTIDLTYAPYYVTLKNKKQIIIKVFDNEDAIVNVSNVVFETDENFTEKEIYSKVFSNLDTQANVSKWSVLKDADVTLSKSLEKNNVKVGSGAMHYRFENMRSEFSWGQVTYNVEDLIKANLENELVGFSFWLYNQSYVPAGELGFMIKLLLTDGVEYEVKWQAIACSENIYNGFCYQGWQKFEIPINSYTSVDCDYNEGYNPDNLRQLDWTKLKSISIGIWGYYYDYENGYSCDLVLDDVRLVSRKPFNSPSHTITYELNGGTMPDEYSETYTEGISYVLPEPTKKGYTFDGWYTNDSFYGEPVTSISINETGNINLFANWIKDSKKGCRSSVSTLLLFPLLSVSSIYFIYKKKKSLKK